MKRYLRQLGVTRAAQRAYESVAPHLPGRLVAGLDRRLPGYVGSRDAAFNGQRKRQEVFADLCRVIRFLAVVETGTHRGTTTEYMQVTSGLPVYSVETVGRYFHFARSRLKPNKNITVEHDDSRRFLARLAVTHSELLGSPVVFYLDAHSQSDLPLRDELLLIAASWLSAVIIIDDFEVPDDSGYGYDDFGSGRRLAVEYLPSPILDRFDLYAPATTSAEDSGKRRGYAVLAPRAFGEVIASVPGLRQMPDVPHSSSMRP